MSVTIADSEAFVTLNASLDGNATLFQQRRIRLSGEELSSLGRALSSSVKERQPGASLAEISATITENSTRINVTATFTVRGLSAEGRQGFDFSWRSLRSDEPLVAGNVSYNRVGATYLRPLIERIANDTGVEFLVNRTAVVTGARAMNMAGNFTLLDFMPLSAPLDRWERKFDAGKGVTILRFRSAPTLDITVKAGPKHGSAAYRFSAVVAGEVIAPGLASVGRDTISIERGTEPYLALMIAFIGLPIVGLLYTLLRSRAPGRGRKPP